MPKRENQKQKLLYLMKIFNRKTDEQHKLTTAEILEQLAKEGVEAERRTLYRDFDDLREFGIDIVGEQIGRNYYYYVKKRDFSLAELKLLVDSIQVSRFLTEKTSRDLIKKLERLTSEHEAKQLQRQVTINGRIKSTNSSVLANVDKIHGAIGGNRQIRFQYYQWNVQKEKVLRHNGRWYHISPWGLVVNDQNYYLLGFDADSGRMKNYRVDKMLRLSVIENARIGKAEFERIDMVSYTQQTFGMFSGKAATVRLRVANELAGVMIDRFGQEIMLVPEEDGWFTVSVEVSVSERFLGWLGGFGTKVKVEGPEWVKERMKEHFRGVYEVYCGE